LAKDRTDRRIINYVVHGLGAIGERANRRTCRKENIFSTFKGCTSQLSNRDPILRIKAITNTTCLTLRDKDKEMVHTCRASFDKSLGGDVISSIANEIKVWDFGRHIISILVGEDRRENRYKLLVKDYGHNMGDVGIIFDEPLDVICRDR
jgi:hypothetical protein